MNKPASILVVILCAPERNGWVNPSLWLASLLWAQDERFDLRFKAAEGFATSQEARNQACRWLLEGSEDFLLMIDNDTRTDVNERLVNLPDLAALNLDVVAAPVPVLQAAGLFLNTYMHSRQPGQEHLFEPSAGEDFGGCDDRGLLERDAVGTGAVMIARRVVEALATDIWVPDWLRPYVPAGETSKPLPTFLRPRNTDGTTVLGEDYVFCDRARHLGFRIHSSLRHVCGHYHTIDQLQIPSIAIVNRRVPTAEDFGLAALPLPWTSHAILPEHGALLRRLIAEKRPTNVLELGSGVSTLVISDALARSNNGCRLQTVDHDSKHLENVAAACQHLGLNHVAFHYSPLSKDGWYEYQRVLPARKYDFVFVDGPPGDSGRMARYPALPKLARSLKPGAVIVLDDAQRPDEQETIKRWQAEFRVRATHYDVGDRRVAVMTWPEET